MRTKSRIVTVMCTESGFDDAMGHLLQLARQAQRGRARGDGGEPAATVTDTRREHRRDRRQPARRRGQHGRLRHPPGAAEDSLHVRCRIDGVLHDLREFPQGAASRHPQPPQDHGQPQYRRAAPATRRTHHVRALQRRRPSTCASPSIPSLYGENITIRILEVSPLPPTLASLGLGRRRISRASRLPSSGRTA